MAYFSRSAQPPSRNTWPPIAACGTSEDPNLKKVAHLGSCHLEHCHLGSHPWENTSPYTIDIKIFFLELFGPILPFALHQIQYKYIAVLYRMFQFELFLVL